MKNNNQTIKIQIFDFFSKLTKPLKHFKRARYEPFCVGVFGGKLYNKITNCNLKI